MSCTPVTHCVSKGQAGPLYLGHLYTSQEPIHCLELQPVNSLCLKPFWPGSLEHRPAQSVTPVGPASMFGPPAFQKQCPAYPLHPALVFLTMACCSYRLVCCLVMCIYGCSWHLCGYHHCGNYAAKACRPQTLCTHNVMHTSPSIWHNNVPSTGKFREGTHPKIICVTTLAKKKKGKKKAAPDIVHQWPSCQRHNKLQTDNIVANLAQIRDFWSGKTSQLRKMDSALSLRQSWSELVKGSLSPTRTSMSGAKSVKMTLDYWRTPNFEFDFQSKCSGILQICCFFLCRWNFPHQLKTFFAAAQQCAGGGKGPRSNLLLFMQENWSFWSSWIQAGFNHPNSIALLFVALNSPAAVRPLCK